MVASGWATSAAMFTPTDCLCGALERILPPFDYMTMDEAKYPQTVLGQAEGRALLHDGRNSTV
jgi:hypothetical protein